MPSSQKGFLSFRLFFLPNKEMRRRSETFEKDKGEWRRTTTKKKNVEKGTTKKYASEKSFKLARFALRCQKNFFFFFHAFRILTLLRQLFSLRRAFHITFSHLFLAETNEKFFVGVCNNCLSIKHVVLTKCKRKKFIELWRDTV